MQLANGVLELLDRVLELIGHGVECDAQVADFVAFVRSFESSAQSSALVGDFARFLSQLSQRLHDRRAHQESENHGHDDGGQKNLQNCKADGVDVLPDLVRRL